MDKQIMTVLFSFALYVIYVLLPMIPALVIYKLFPNTKISANGKLSGWDLKTTGAFAGYVITVVLGYFLVQNTHQLIAQMNSPYWNIVAKVELQNIDGTPYRSNVSAQDISETTEVTIYPELASVKYGTVHLKMPGHKSEWSTAKLILNIPGYGKKSIELKDLIEDAKIDQYNLSAVLSKPIVVVMDKQIAQGYNLDSATPLTPATQGAGPKLVNQ